MLIRMLKRTILALLVLCGSTSYAAIGTLALDSTYASISVNLSATTTDYTETNLALTGLVLEYRVTGSTSWTTGHPLARLSANRYAGSILFLQQNTSYDVRVKETGCVTSACWETGTVSTKSPVFTTGTGTNRYVAKTGNDSNPGTEAQPYLTISKAATVVNAGDVVHVKPGIYYEQVLVNRSGSAGNYIKFVGDGQVYVSGANPTYDVVNGTDDWTYDAPSNSYKCNIGYRTYFVGYSRGSRVFNYRQSKRVDESGSFTFADFVAGAATGVDSGYWSADDGWLYVRLPGVIDPDTVTMQIGAAGRNIGLNISSAHHVIIENFDIGYLGFLGSTASYGINVLHSSNVVIRYNRIHHAYAMINVSGSTVFSPPTADNNLIELNEFYDDPHFLSWPWGYSKEHDTENCGVLMDAGGGNVARDNRIHDVFNGVTATAWGHLTNESSNYNLDVYGNDLQRIGDDCLEPEGTNINNRFWNNVCTDVMVGISIGPITVGPVYMVRNQIKNFAYYVPDTGSGMGIKMANGGVYGGFGRVYFYHNTAYTLRAAVNAVTTVQPIGNLVFRNNIISGDRYGIEISQFQGMPVPCSFDYNNIYTVNSTGLSNWVSAWFWDISGTNAGTQQYFLSSYALFVTNSGQESHGFNTNPMFTDTAIHDIRLQSGSPGRNTGIVIQGINDRRYAESAPDMGAIEYGLTVTAPDSLKIVP